MDRRLVVLPERNVDGGLMPARDHEGGATRRRPALIVFPNQRRCESVLLRRFIMREYQRSRQLSGTRYSPTGTERGHSCPQQAPNCPRCDRSEERRVGKE